LTGRPGKRRVRRRAAWWALGALCATALGAVPPYAASDEEQQYLPVTAIIPAYVSASNPEWGVLTGAPQGIGAVIVNPESGPGPAPNPRLARRAAELRAHGIVTLGYVGTDFGDRPAQEVLEEMHRYRVWYGVNGFFFDEGARGTRALPYYRRLRRAAGSMYVVLNTGRPPARRYLAVADTIVTFEGSAAEYRGARTPGWTTRVPRRRVAHVVYATPRADRAEVVALAQKRNAGFLFVTDAGPPNPYNRLPSYFGAERGDLIALGGKPR
jgi:hypothetical protein